MRTLLRSSLLQVLAVIAIVMSLGGHAVLADPLGNWTTQQVSTNWFGLNSVVYGNGTFVAAGSYSDYGTIISSTDGLHWTVTAGGGFPNPPGAPIWGLHVDFARGRFIAVSAWGGTAVSTDGINWTLGSAPIPNGYGPLFLYGATYGLNRYVAVGQPEPGFGMTVSNIVTSSDGVTWTLRRSHPTEARLIVDVDYGNGIYVAIGAGDGFTYTSNDALTWTRRPIPGGNGISFCGGLFIVPYSASTNLISTDGINWSAQNTGLSGGLGKVTFVNGLFMAGTAVSLATSTDGTNWIPYVQNLPGWGLACDGARLVTFDNVSTNSLYYNSFVHVSEVLVGISMTNSPSRKIALSGLVGRSYRVETTKDLAPNTLQWLTLTNLQLPSSPYLFEDITATNSAKRFYRGVLLP